ncbi:MAG: hypothetical protein IK085_09160 [Clostridia bacterium]|nr:hypothetical protein [Clostridia bacterium]
MKKIIALLLALSFVLCMAACGAKNDGEELTSDVITVAESTEESTEAPETTEAPEESTEAPADETTTAEETTAEETTEAAKKPETKEEIVEYFNTAVNGVKTNAKSATRNYSKISLAGPTTLPSALSGILRILGGADKFLGDQLAKNSKGSETFTGSQIKNVYPVENESYASKLTAADVQTATCTEADGKYTITITTVPDGKSANIQYGQGHAPKAFNVVLPGVVNDNIPGVATSMVGTATMNYPSSKATIVVDKETGNVLTANYDLYWTINFDKAGAVLPFLTSDSWTIKY